MPISVTTPSAEQIATAKTWPVWTHDVATFPWEYAESETCLIVEGRATVAAADGSEVSETIPVGPQLLVAIGDEVEAGAALTNDPNVGGFGQLDTEVVLQNPVRIYGLLAFFAAVALAQIMLVLKKKQVEKVQAAEGV